VEPLVNALRVAFTVRTGAGFYLRAEIFSNTATAIDALGMAEAYGGRSLHEQSHGESFIFSRNQVSSAATAFTSWMSRKRHCVRRGN
jgi:predicted ATPase